MSVIFLTEQGSVLTRQGSAFVLKKEGKTIFMYPSGNVKQVVLFGRIEITTPMIHLLLKEGINTTFLTFDGRFRGRLVGDSGKNILLREKQFQRALDPTYCFEFAKNVVWAKAKNTMRMLQKKQTVHLREFFSRVNNYKKNLAKLNTSEQLRGMEGYFSAMYFRLFPQLLIENFGFRKRMKHPPPDPVNILLSFGYTLLFQNLYALIQALGLDPFKGFYHQTHYGHPALVSDLMEEFRAAIVDSLVISLINRRQISSNHFEKEEKKIRMNQEAIKIIVTQYREKLQTPLKYRGMTLTYMQILEAQVVALVKSIQNGSPYQPFIYP